MTMSKKHPQNGSTFSDAPLKKHKPMTDAEIFAFNNRKAAQQAQTELDSAKERESHRLLRTGEFMKRAMQKLP
jgi:hypothetical protein